MAKNRYRQERVNNRQERGRIVSQKAAVEHEEVRVNKPITPKTNLQKELLSALQQDDVILVDAPAGTGKTFVTMSTVVDWLKQGKIDKIILSRPTVGMGNSLGLLPGSIREKFEPYLAAMVQVIKQRYGVGFYESQLGRENIEFVPLEYVRGRSFENAVVIVDESQNTTEDDMYTIMTRLGEGSKLVFLGDRTQNDMKGRLSGLEWGIDFVERHGDVGDFATTVVGTSDDIVRSGFCKAVVQAREWDNDPSAGSY